MKPPSPEYVSRAEIHRQTDKMLDEQLADPSQDAILFVFKKIIEQCKAVGIPKEEISDKFIQALNQLYAPSLKLVSSIPSKRKESIGNRGRRPVAPKAR